MLLSVARGCTSRNLRKVVKLPVKGTIRFIPKRADVMRCEISRSDGGYIDKFDNVWKKPRGMLRGDFHWDVQLSTTGKINLGGRSASGKHLNVTQDGRVPH